MTLRGYFQVLHLRSLWILASGSWIVGFALAALFHDPDAGDRSLWVFTGGVLFSPALLGMTLSGTVWAVQQRPFIMVLPGARWQLARWHAATMICAAAACLIVSSRSIPAPASFFLPLAALSLALVIDPSGCQRKRIWVAIGGLLMLAGFFAIELREAVITAPWIASLLGFGITTGSFALGFSRDQQRNIALMLEGSTVGPTIRESLSEGATQKEALARSKRLGRRWNQGPIGGSIRQWLGVVTHEVYGSTRTGWSGRLIPVFLLAYACDVVIRLFGTKGNLVESFQAFQAPRTLHGGMLDLILVLFLIASSNPPRLRPAHLYPQSRAHLAQVTYAASAMHSAFYFTGFVLLAILVSGLHALVAGLPFQTAGISHFTGVLMVALPVIPIFQWVELHISVHPDKQTQSQLLLFSTFLIGMIISIVVRSTHAALLSPTGIVVILLITAASQWAYYLGVCRFYRKRDLLQRGTHLQLPGLV